MTQSLLEATLLNQVRMAGLPMPTEQYRAIPNRRWRWDFAWMGVGLLVEVQGGTYVPGLGHSSGSGIECDYAQNNAAVLAGWRVLFFDTNMVQDGTALATIEQALKGETK